MKPLPKAITAARHPIEGECSHIQKVTKRKARRKCIVCVTAALEMNWKTVGYVILA